jgi:uncharacterized protein YndB with AHSA1/START domain
MPRLKWSLRRSRKLSAVWWGPAGFTNTFDTFEFKPGAKWSFSMHGPDGKSYPNENVVTEIEPPTRIIIHHVRFCFNLRP